MRTRWTMSFDAVLLARSWPERRPVVLASAVLGFAAVAAGDPGAVAALHVLPVVLVALELGLSGGLAAAALAVVLALAGGAASNIVPLALAVVTAGAVAGRFSDKMRAAHAREQRLLDSGLALTAATGYERLPAEVGTAALRTPRATGVAVEFDGAPPYFAGRSGGRTATTHIAARGALIGRVHISHERELDPGDRAARGLLALHAGLAADNHHLLAQRSGLGRVLDAVEDDRRRLAETLHEELAQALAAVLLGLRMVGRDQPSCSLQDLHRQVAGVLDGVRSMATTLRPWTLAQLGLVPALEGLSQEHGLSVEAVGVVDPLPEPLRTGTYRLVEQVVAGARGEPATLRLTGSSDRLDAALDVAIDRTSEPVAAAGAQAALLGGSLRAEPLAGGGTRLRIRLPLQEPVEADAPTGSVALRTVRPGADSISSRPCASATRSCIPATPNPSTRASGSNPRPSSETSTRRTS
jgi:signal transduction histidine kinase